MCNLPNPIPTNKPNVEPKRPPRPVHLTPLCKLTPTLNNVVNIKWAADYGKNWVVGIWLVEKLSSEQLLDRSVNCMEILRSQYLIIFSGSYGRGKGTPNTLEI